MFINQELCKITPEPKNKWELIVMILWNEGTLEWLRRTHPDDMAFINAVLEDREHWVHKLCQCDLKVAIQYM